MELENLGNVIVFVAALIVPVVVYRRIPILAIQSSGKEQKVAKESKGQSAEIEIDNAVSTSIATIQVNLSRLIIAAFAGLFALLSLFGTVINNRIDDTNERLRSLEGEIHDIDRNLSNEINQLEGNIADKIDSTNTRIDDANNIYNSKLDDVKSDIIAVDNKVSNNAGGISRIQGQLDILIKLFLGDGADN